MSTASTANVLKEDGSTPADPFDMGGGRVDLSMAGQAGLVLDESTADFLAADPALGGQPKDLNLASLGEDQCLLSCTWTREVTNPQGFTTTWEAVTTAPAGMTLTVTPSTFSLAPSASQVLTITADVASMPVDQWAFAEVTLQPTMAYLQVAHLAPFAADPGTAVTVTLNSTAVLTDFAFADSTGYIPVPAGSYLVEIFPGGSSTAAISDTLMVSSGTDYTVIAVGDGVNQALDLLALVDDNSAPAAGDAKLRIGHLAPFASGAATADVRLEDGSPVITDVVYGAVAPYLSLPEASYDLRITAPGGDPTLINPLAVGLNDGDILSAFAVGDGANQALGVFALPSGKPGFLLPLYLGAELYLPLVPRNDGGALAAPERLGVEDYSHITAALLNNANAVPPAHFPVAVKPTTGTVPDHVDIFTRRDAGSKTLADLTAIEITDLTVDAYGLTQAALTTQLLDQDPTNDDPYDTITGTFYVTTTVPSGAIRLVAETYNSTAVDMDLFVGTGDTPSAGTEVCSSTTATAFEYCEITEPAAGTWWVLVQNWDDSASPPDAVTLAYGVVPGTDAGNMTVVGPSSQPELDPFDLTIFYDEPAMTAGDRWYGAFDLGSDAGSPGNIARVTVDVQRFDDDVTKTVSDDTPDFSDTLTYTITVLPNITGVDLTYALTDTIPAGLTYVGGSAAANFGTVNVVGDTLTWTGEMPGKGSYAVETSMTDPVGCIMPLANSGAYVDLEGYGILTDPGISGDTVWYSFNPSGGEFEFFGENQGEVINFTDDGFAFFDPSTPGATPYANEPIPTAGDPDNLMSIFWRDLEIVYDAGLNRGVSLANLTSGGVPSAAIVEYDDVEDWPAGSGTTYDVEMLARYFADPGWYEYIFAYDNLNGNVLTGTIGLENASGTDGAEYAYDNIAVTDGMAVCFDYSDPTTPAEITYQVTIDGIGMLTNDVVSTTDDPGSMPETTSVTVDIVGGPAIGFTKTVGTDINECATTGSIIVGPGTDVYYCYEVVNTGTFTLTLHDLVDTELGTILDDFPFSLTPGASVFVTQTANITTTTINTATWTAFNAGPVDVASASDSATVLVNQPAPLVCNGATVGFDVGVPFDWVVADNEMSGVAWTSIALSGESGNFTGGTGEAASVSSDVAGAAEFDTELWSPPFDTTGWITVTLDYLVNYQNFAGA